MTTIASNLLTLLKRRGVDHLVANAGTDFAPIIEAMTQDGAADMPIPVIAPHETAAAGLAHGYYLQTGRPQAVMVHVNVGLANTVMGVINAARDNIPMLLLSGRTPISERGQLGSRDVPIHWGQEMRDQGAMIREFTKWDYELRHASDLEIVIDRALAIAMSEPRGPVYLSLPREVLAEAAETVTASAVPRQQPSAPPAPDPDALAQAAKILAAARNPLILTSRSGRDADAIPALADFAQTTAIPVVEYWSTHMNLPADHPMHAGYGPVTFQTDIDAVLVLDSMVPWVPGRGEPTAGCPVIQIGPDPLFQEVPVRGFPVTVGLTSKVSTALPALGEAVCAAWTSEDRRAADQRRDRLTAEHDGRRGEAATKASTRSTGLADHAWVGHCLNARKSTSDIIVNEIGVDRARDSIGFTEHGTYHGLSVAGGLGWGLPAALGAKLAEPDRMVVATVGDGSYMFANPLACHQMATALDLPILTIIFNNGRWNAVRNAALTVYPDGTAARANLMPLTSLEPSPDYEKVVEACGGHGERVENAEDLPAALDRAYQVVQMERRQALINVRCA